MLQRGVELCEGASAVLLVEEMGERVAEADDRVELPVHLAVQPPPVGVDRLEDQVPVGRVLERLGEHDGVAVDARHLEAGVGELDRVEARAGRDVEDLHLAARLQLLDEEAALALRSRGPVDQLVPLLDEGLDVLGLVVIGLANGGRRLTEVLADRAQRSFGLLAEDLGRIRRHGPLFW